MPDDDYHQISVGMEIYLRATGHWTGPTDSPEALAELQRIVDEARKLNATMRERGITEIEAFEP